MITNYRQLEYSLLYINSNHTKYYAIFIVHKKNKETNSLQLLAQLIGDPLYQDSLNQSHSLLLCAEIINKVILEKFTFPSAVEAVYCALVSFILTPR
jgi:hypothetical protein